MDTPEIDVEGRIEESLKENSSIKQMEPNFDEAAEYGCTSPFSVDLYIDLDKNEFDLEHESASTGFSINKPIDENDDKSELAGLDLYSDILTSELQEKQQFAEKAFEDLQKLTAEYKMLQEQLKVVNSKLEQMEKQNIVLKYNISALYKTAKAEIERKDSSIHELRERLDSIIFRRHRRGNLLLNGHKVAKSVENCEKMIQYSRNRDDRREFRDICISKKNYDKTLHNLDRKDESKKQISTRFSKIDTDALKCKKQMQDCVEKLNRNCNSNKKDKISSDPLVDSTKENLEALGKSVQKEKPYHKNHNKSTDDCSRQTDGNISKFDGRIAEKDNNYKPKEISARFSSLNSNALKHKKHIQDCVKKSSRNNSTNTEDKSKISSDGFLGSTKKNSEILNKGTQNNNLHHNCKKVIKSHGESTDSKQRDGNASIQNGRIVQKDNSEPKENNRKENNCRIEREKNSPKCATKTICSVIVNNINSSLNVKSSIANQHENERQNDSVNFTQVEFKNSEKKVPDMKHIRTTAASEHADNIISTIKDYNKESSKFEEKENRFTQRKEPSSSKANSKKLEIHKFSDIKKGIVLLNSKVPKEIASTKCVESGNTYSKKRKCDIIADEYKYNSKRMCQIENTIKIFQECNKGEYLENTKTISEDRNEKDHILYVTDAKENSKTMLNECTRKENRYKHSNKCHEKQIHKNKKQKTDTHSINQSLASKKSHKNHRKKHRKERDRPKNSMSYHTRSSHVESKIKNTENFKAYLTNEKNILPKYRSEGELSSSDSEGC